MARSSLLLQRLIFFADRFFLFLSCDNADVGLVRRRFISLMFSNGLSGHCMCSVQSGRNVKIKFEWLTFWGVQIAIGAERLPVLLSKPNDGCLAVNRRHRIHFLHLVKIVRSNDALTVEVIELVHRGAFLRGLL